MSLLLILSFCLVTILIYIMLCYICKSGIVALMVLIVLSFPIGFTYCVLDTVEQYPNGIYNEELNIQPNCIYDQQGIKYCSDTPIKQVKKYYMECTNENDCVRVDR